MLFIFSLINYQYHKSMSSSENCPPIPDTVAPSSPLISDKPRQNEKLEDIKDTIPDSQGIKLSKQIRWMLFLTLAAISTLSNLDGGIIPAATKEMQRDMRIGETEIGFFFSIYYLGRIIGSLTFVAIINTVNRRIILVGTLFIKGISLFIPRIPDFDKSYAINLICRGISGFSQVYYTIYLPVWCDQYGPKKSKTIMITITQLGLPLGIVLGFTMATIIGKDNWVLCFNIEGIILGALGIACFSFPKLYFSNTLMLVEGSNDRMQEMPSKDEGEEQQVQNIDTDSKSPSSIYKEGEAKKKKKNSIFKNIGTIISEPVFIFTGLANSVVFFGMAVVQFWGANYMEKVIGVTNEWILLYVFSAICITGPPAGIILGGVIGGKIGGYTVRKAIVFCVGLCAMSCIFALIITIDSTHVAYFGVMVWLYFFFSGATTPLETGIVISSLPEKLRGDGFSVMNFFLNLVGNLPAAPIYGFIFERTETTHNTYAMFFTMSYNLVGLIFVILGMVFRLKKKDKDEEPKKEELKRPIEGETTIPDNITKMYGAYGNPKEAIQDNGSEQSPDA